MNYNFSVRIGDKTVDCRAFTLREYKDLLEAKMNGRMEDEIHRIFSVCTNAKNLNRQESELLLVKLWVHSIGEVNHEHIYQCECGKEQNVPMNFDMASIVDEGELLYSFENFKIKFKYPKIFEDKNKAHMVVGCIDYIIAGDEQIFVDDLNDAEIDDIWSAITFDHLEKIIELLMKPQVQMAIPISCECGRSHVEVISGLKDFFKLL